MTATRPAPVTSASVKAELERAFRQRHITVDPAAAAELALGVVLPHFRALVGENKRLQKLVAEYVVSGKKRSEGEERRG
jgi:hypothetical protein